MSQTEVLQADIQQFAQTVDEPTLIVVREILSASSKELEEASGDWWDSTPDHIKRAIQESIDSLDRGEGIPHEEAIKKLRSWKYR